jgi:protein phosphatase 1 regulatory subunit 3A/B/C/D/E
LADVKTFLDEVPRVPKSAYKDLKDAEISDLDSETSSESQFPSCTSRLNVLSAPVLPTPPMAVQSSMSLVPMFNQPGGFANFFDLLRERKVCLENAFMNDSRSIRGTIRVQNIGFHKKVTMVYTTNEWSQKTEMEADYLQGSCDGFSDKFTFFLALPPLSVGRRLQFCIRYTVNDQEFWDSNDGKNYVFQCLGVSSGASSGSANQSMGAASSMAAAPRAIPQSRGGHMPAYGISHSPSAMSEEPWLRYL